jgi:hypothetical protein
MPQEAQQEAQEAEQGVQSEEEVRAVLREAKQPLQVATVSSDACVA